MRHLNIKRLHEKAKMPERQTEGSVGFDISACIEEAIVILPGETRLIYTGIAIALEQGYAAFIYARSGLGVRHGITPANCVGVIDSDYRGEIVVGLRNSSDKPFTVNDGDRIAQMVITKCELPELVMCDDLDETSRDSGGFGSTGE